MFRLHLCLSKCFVQWSLENFDADVGLTHSGVWLAGLELWMWSFVCIVVDLFVWFVCVYVCELSCRVHLPLFHFHWTTQWHSCAVYLLVCLLNGNCYMISKNKWWIFLYFYLSFSLFSFQISHLTKIYKKGTHKRIHQGANLSFVLFSIQQNSAKNSFKSITQWIH